MSRFSAALNLLACALLASCASSTMDSIPIGERMEIYKDQAQRDFQDDFARIGELHMTHVLSDAEYKAQYAELQDKVVQRAHTLAWNQHNLAELEVIDAFNWNKLLYEAHFGFEPVCGEVYHLYEVGTKCHLSMIEPEKWHQRWIGSFRLNADGRWQVEKTAKDFNIRDWVSTRVA